MKKEGVIFILLLTALIIFFSFLVIAQEQPTPDIQNTPDTQNEAGDSVNEDVEDIENSDDASLDNGDLEDDVGDDGTLDQDEESKEQVEDNILDEVEEEYKNEDLNIDAGITPDSPFYFVDEFFDRFGDDLSNREEKIAEINSMIEKGKIEGAREALKNYEKYAGDAEKNINPEKRDDARRSVATIKRTLNEIESKVSESEKKEFVDDILEKEESIITAVEIADKIKNLCEQLSKLDPSSYYETCNSGDDSPNWQKKLDRKLTGEQKEEAKNFGEIMRSCFKTSGRDCKCEEIPFPDFSAACFKAVPLATKCDEGDENACDELDSLEMPGLPPHLQGIMDELEGDVSESKYDLHMPPECQKADAKTPKECSKIMIETRAPPECKEALLKANVESEKDGREICDKIMMEKYAPECAEKGITDHDECKDYMYGIGNRPKECQENQIHDARDCKRFLEDGGRGKSMNLGKNCKSIENPEERLKCYDGVISGEDFGGEGENFEERFRDVKGREMDCAAHCSARNERWDGLEGGCRCYAGNKEESRDREDFFIPEERREFQSPEERREFRSPEEFREGEFQPPEGFQEPPREGEFQQPPTQQIPSTESGSEGTTTPENSPPSESSGGSESSGSSSSEESSGSSSSGDSGGESSDESSGGGITGNAFLDYYFR